MDFISYNAKENLPFQLSKANIDVEEFVERFKKPTKPIGWYGKDDKFRRIVAKALSREPKDRFVLLNYLIFLILLEFQTYKQRIPPQAGAGREAED